MEIINREARNPHRKIKEAIHIRLLGVMLNRNDGAYLPYVYLPLLWEEVWGAAGETDQYTGIKSHSEMTSFSVRIAYYYSYYLKKLLVLKLFICYTILDQCSKVSF